MGKKAILFIVIGALLGVVVAAGGVFFLLSSDKEQPEEEVVEIQEFDVANEGKRFTLEKVQIPLVMMGSKASYLQADFTIIFKTEDALKKAEAMTPDIKSAIYGVFETKTADELRAKPVANENNSEEKLISPREAMREPVLEAIRNLYLTEEDKENIHSVVISSFMVI